MGKSAILLIDELAQGQTQAFLTVNDGMAALEEAANKKKTITSADFTANAYTCSEIDFVRYTGIEVTSLAADSTITLPTTVNGNTSVRLFAIINVSTTYKITVGSIVVPRSSARLLQITGSTMRIVAEAGVPSGIPHTTAFFASGHPVHDDEVLRYVFVEPVSWAANASGSDGDVRVAPSPGSRFYLYKNGSKIGDVIVSTGGAVSFSIASATSWAVGDVLTVKFEALETGTVTFNAVADTNDTITVDNGTDTPVVFTFGGGGGQVAPGSTATDSATNLKAAIEASAIAATVSVSQSTNVLTIVNLLAAGGGALTKSDADNDYTIVDFTTDATSEDYGITFYGTRT
ncbi:MAG: hypothetical protein AB7U75_14210 [Hyphomicrobiaceae bacterium]